MKEVESQHSYVGKIVTCRYCLRSFMIEAGDQVVPGIRSRRVIRSDSIMVPCCERLISIA